MREEGSEGRIKRMTCWCREVCKIDRGRIYLSPDGSVLGVHLWRNEISGRLSGRGRLCCPAAYTLTQHPACSVCSHTTCSAFNLPDHSVYTSVCVCVCVHRSRGLQTGLLSHAASPSNDWGSVFHSALPRWLFGSSPAGSWNLLVEPATKSSARHRKHSHLELSFQICARVFLRGHTLSSPPSHTQRPHPPTVIQSTLMVNEVN